MTAMTGTTEIVSVLLAIDDGLRLIRIFIGGIDTILGMSGAPTSLY